MGEDWKSWKTRLVKEFIRDDNPKNPCDLFNITDEEWTEFRRQKESDEFKVFHINYFNYVIMV